MTDNDRPEGLIEPERHAGDWYANQAKWASWCAAKAREAEANGDHEAARAYRSREEGYRCVGD